MTSEEIRAAVEQSAELKAFQAEGRINAIAQALSVGRTKVVSHFASERGILERLPAGPLAADALLSKLESFAASGHPMASIVKRALKFLAQAEGLDIGSPATQGLIAQLASGKVITDEERDGLRAMATVADPVTDAQVEEALKA